MNLLTRYSRNLLCHFHLNLPLKPNFGRFLISFFNRNEKKVRSKFAVTVARRSGFHGNPLCQFGRQRVPTNVDGYSKLSCLALEGVFVRSLALEGVFVRSNSQVFLRALRWT